MNTNEKIQYISIHYKDEVLDKLLKKYLTIRRVYIDKFQEINYDNDNKDIDFNSLRMIGNLCRESTSIMNRLYYEPLYLLSSLKYYIKTLRTYVNRYFSIDNGFDNNTRSDKHERITFNTIALNIKLVLATFSNYINGLVEKFIIKTKKHTKFITIFEASPIDQSVMEFNLEVDQIRNIVNKNYMFSGYYPIVRFATNDNIFEKTLVDYKPKVIHLACHGEEKTLIFIGAKGTSREYKSKRFVNFLNRELHGCVINLIYINACYSLSYASEVRRNKRMPTKVYKTIGYLGKNFDKYAIDFSKLFYNHYFYSKYLLDVCKAYNNAKLDFIKHDPYKCRMEYLKKLRICKR